MTLLDGITALGEVTAAVTLIWFTVGIMMLAIFYAIVFVLSVIIGVLERPYYKARAVIFKFLTNRSKKR